MKRRQRRLWCIYSRPRKRCPREGTACAKALISSAQGRSRGRCPVGLKAPSVTPDKWLKVKYTIAFDFSTTPRSLKEPLPSTFWNEKPARNRARYALIGLHAAKSQGLPNPSQCKMTPRSFHSEVYSECSEKAHIGLMQGTSELRSRKVHPIDATTTLSGTRTSVALSEHNIRAMTD